MISAFGRCERQDSATVDEPPAFRGRNASAVAYPSPIEVIGLSIASLIVFFLFFMGGLVWLFIFWPIRVLRLIGSFCAFKRKSNRATCPNCGGSIKFSGTAFNCPFCQHRLMEHDSSLYDVA